MPITKSTALLFAGTMLLGCMSEKKSVARVEDPSVAHTQAPFPTDTIVYHYYQQLVSRIKPELDTTWYANFEDPGSEEMGSIFRSGFGGVIDTYADFSVTNLSLRYYDGEPGQDYFLLKGQKFPEPFTGNNEFPINSIRRFRYRGGEYLVFNGGLQQFNGYGGRVNFNYFFDLSRNRIVADMYENNWGYIRYPFLYGDLNADLQLDRIRFDGILYPGMDCLEKERQFAASGHKHPVDRCVDTITITAETYRMQAWRPMLDSKSKPFFIKLLVVEEKSIELGNYNWMDSATVKLNIPLLY